MSELCEEEDSFMGPVLKRWNIFGDSKLCLPVAWREQGEGFSNFQSMPDDVWIMSLPRSGTTWTLEMVWLLANDLDYENAGKFHHEERVPELVASLYPSRWIKPKVAIRSLENSKQFLSVSCDNNNPSYVEFAKIPSPRFFKTHLSFSISKNLLVSGAKTVYVARNMKDRLSSFYIFLTSGSVPIIELTFKQYWKFLKQGHIIYTPMWDHLKEGWAQRNNPNVLYLFYEDLKSDLPGTLKKIAKCLGKSYTDEEIMTLANHLHIDKFRKNPMVNSVNGLPSTDSCFIGAGKIGGYKDVIPPDIEKEMDQWIDENLKDTDIPFPTVKKSQTMT